MQPLALTAAQSRAVDRHAIEVLGLPGLVLMENAGAGAAGHILERAGEGPIGILCGPGNNGGDGYVVARHLLIAGLEVRVFHTRRAEDLKGDALVNRQVLDRLAPPSWHLLDSTDVEPAEAELAGCELLVDALLGTGATGEPRGPVAELLACLQRLALPVVALDLPTGLDADTGRAALNTVQAVHTLTFCALKVGLLAEEAREYCGRVDVVPIGVPEACLREAVGLA